MYTRYHFPNQKPNEQILLFYRRHWLILLKTAFLGVVMAVIPVFFYVYFSARPELFSGETFYALYVLLNSIFALFIIVFMFSNFIDYYLDVWLVTNMRVVAIEQEGLFGRQMAEKDLGRMQDIKAEVKGFIPTIFGYGNVKIQTAGEEEHFIFRQIPHAEEATRQIANLVSEYRRSNPELVSHHIERQDSEEME